MIHGNVYNHHVGKTKYAERNGNSGAKMGDLQKKLKPLTVNGGDCNDLGRKEVYSNLKEHQWQVYDQLAGLLNKHSNKVVLIDAPSGTGKTFLLSTWAAARGEVVTFISFRKDQASDISLNGIISETYVSFCMRHFKVPYSYAIRMFNSSERDELSKLHKLIECSKTFNSDGIKAIVLDTYTIASPTMLLLLYIMSLKNGFHLIFAGHILQLGAINKSELHNGGNYHFVKMFNDITVENFSRNVRICDTVLDKKMSKFYKMLQRSKSNGKLLFDFDLQYNLYNVFKAKYFTEECFDTVYIAQTHSKIKTRLTRFAAYLGSTAIQYVKAPFFYKKNDAWVPIPPKHAGRFLPYLILAEGCKYIHVTSDGVHQIVELEEMTFLGDEVQALYLRVLKNNQVIVIERKILNYYQILPAYRYWLFTDLIHTGELYQFPLRHYTLTYHAALGRTIEKDKVELDADCTFANSIYIGLSCARHESSIHKIHSPYLFDYMVTEYMENMNNDFDYYYRCPTADNMAELLKDITDGRISNFIEKIEWVDVDRSFFERKRIGTYARIKRSEYTQSGEKDKGDKKDVQTLTPLMKVAKFAKENPNIIRDAMKMSATENNKHCNGSNAADKKKKKNKKKQIGQSYSEIPSYNYLKKEYDRWTIENERKTSEMTKRKSK